MTTIGKITEKLDEIGSRSNMRRDVPHLIEALTDAVATIGHLCDPKTRMTPQQRSKLADDALDRVADILGERN